jgi:hypothetical protein
MDTTEPVPAVPPLPTGYPAEPAGPSGPAPTKKHWYAKKAVWIPVVVVVLVAALTGVLLVAQSSQNPSTTAGSPGATTVPGQGAVGTGYLAHASNGVIFIQWTQSGTSVNGTAEVDTLSGTPPNQSVSTKTINVTGQLQGSTITLSFNGGTEVFGTLSDGSFTVNFPQSDGSLGPVTFTSATASDFNQALSALQGNTGAQNSQAAAANQLAAEQQNIDKAASAVAGGITGLQSDAASMNASLGAFTQSLAQQQTDLGTEAKLESQVIAESQNGTANEQVCSESDTVASDGDTVDSDGDTVSSDADTTEGDVGDVRTDIADLQNASASLQAAQAALPTYTDGAPTLSAVNQAIASAQKAVTTVLGTANADIAQANSYETQGYQDAQAAANAGSCSGPSQPETQPTIA